MKNTIRRISCSVLAVAMMAGTLCVANAASSKRNNVGNSKKYNSSFNLDLDFYKKDCISSHHKIAYNKPSVTITPYNNTFSWNWCVYYAQYDDDEDGITVDKKSVNYTIRNYKSLTRDLSDGMKLSTWDKNITYFRYDVSPKSNGLNTDKGACRGYNRRASTDITH